MTALCLTIQLILQLKIFDQVYLFSLGGRPNDNMVLVQYIFQQAFKQNQGGRAAAVAVTLFVMVVVVSVLQFQVLRARGGDDDRRSRHFRRDAPASDLGSILLTILTVVCAVLWAFPLYWGVVSSLKPEDEVVGRSSLPSPPDAGRLPIRADPHADRTWYLNCDHVACHNRPGHHHRTCCGYAISQLRFPGRSLLWWLILASFMVPIRR